MKCKKCGGQILGLRKVIEYVEVLNNPGEPEETSDTVLFDLDGAELYDLHCGECDADHDDEGNLKEKKK